MLEVGWASQDMTPVRPAMILGQTHRRVGSRDGSINGNGHGVARTPVWRLCRCNLV